MLITPNSSEGDASINVIDNVTKSEESVGWRVKLYQLETEGAWQDQGTGNVICQNNEDGPKIVVFNDEKSSDILMESKIRSEDIYERQGESIIMWREPARDFLSDIDYALSFQDSAGCMALWESIVAVQRQYITQQEYGQIPTFSHSSMLSNRTDGWIGPVHGSVGAIMIPPVSASNILEIREKFVSMHVSQRDAYATFALGNDGEFIRSLLVLFDQLLDLEDTSRLPRIAEIYRALMLLNDTKVIELIISDKLFLSVASVMEFDPLLKHKVNFREYLSENVRRKNVPGAELTDIAEISAIEKLFKLRFLRDSLARPGLEEMGAGAIESMINIAACDVCSKLFSDLPLLAKILRVISPSLDVGSFLQSEEEVLIPNPHISSPEPKISGLHSDAQLSQNARLDGLKFLRDLFHLSRSLALDRKSELYTRFCLGDGFGQQGGMRGPFFALCLDILANSNSPAIECSLVSEMLLYLTIVCPSFLRQTILQGPLPNFPRDSSAVPRQQLSKIEAQPSHCQNNQCFLWVLIQRVVMDPNNSVIENLGDLIKILIDPERFERQEKNSFLGLFYDHYIFWLLVPFSEEFEPDKRLPSGENWSYVTEYQGQSAVSTSRRVIIELLCWCVCGHSYRMKYFVLRNSAIGLILRLMKSNRHRHLQLSAVKFLRTILASKDEFYFRHIVKQDLLRPILEVMKKAKDGLLMSVVIELVDFICTEGLLTLVTYIIESHSEDFGSCRLCTDVYEKIKIKYDQSRDPDSSTDKNEADKKKLLASTSQRQKRQQERDSEDAYFFDDDDDAFCFDMGAPSSKSVGSSEPSIYIPFDYHDVPDDDIAKNAASVRNSEENSFSRYSSDGFEYFSDSIPLPPLKPKYEIDDSPDTFLRIRTRDTLKVDVIEAKSEEGNIATVSFIMKKRVVRWLLTFLPERFLSFFAHILFISLRFS